MANEGFSLQQLYTQPAIYKGLVSRTPTTVGTFANYYGIGLDASVDEIYYQDSFQFDIFDHVRELPYVSATNAEPDKVQPKVISQGSGTLIRSFEIQEMNLQKLFGNREIGEDWQTTRVPPTGVKNIAKQTEQMKLRQATYREFLASRMFRGGFSFKRVGDKYILKELGESGARDVPSLVPTAHKSQLALGSGGASLITASWATAGTDIAAHINSVSQASERITGYPIKDIWINSTMLANLMNNTKLQAQGGSANAIVDGYYNLGGGKVDGQDVDAIQGYRVRFRGCPLYNFIVYDGHLNTSETETQSIDDKTSFDNNSLVIPNNVAIMLPHRDVVRKAIMLAGGQELVQKTWATPGTVSVYDSWVRKELTAPAISTLFFQKAMPCLINPYVAFYATVVF